MRLADTVGLPTTDEVKTIRPIIEEDFKKAGIAYGYFTANNQGGLLVNARVTKDQWHDLECALFAHGIVPVGISEEIIAFAVRR